MKWTMDNGQFGIKTQSTGLETCISNVAVSRWLHPAMNKMHRISAVKVATGAQPSWLHWPLAAVNRFEN